MQILLYGAVERQSAIQLPRYRYFREDSRVGHLSNYRPKWKKWKVLLVRQRTGEPNRLHYISYLQLNVMVVIVVIVDGVFRFCTFSYFRFPVLLGSNRFYFQRLWTHRKSGWDEGHSPVLASASVSHCHNLNLTHSSTRLILYFTAMYTLYKYLIGKARYIIWKYESSVELPTLPPSTLPSTLQCTR